MSEKAIGQIKVVSVPPASQLDEDWDIRQTAKKIGGGEYASGGSYEEWSYIHPDGYEAKFTAQDPKTRQWCPFEEMNVIVRYGLNSKEHKQFVESQPTTWDVIEECRQHVKDKRAIRSLLHSIGGALNDNRLGYTAEQKQELKKIYDFAEYDEDRYINYLREEA